MKCFRRKYLKTSKNRGLVGIFPPNSKKKEKGSCMFNVFITFNIAGGGLLVFFHDEL